MAQYWIQTPIENAKEVVQRKLLDLGLFPNKKVTYSDDCEVIYYKLPNTFPSFNADIIYFGNIFIADHQNENNLTLLIFDGLSAFTTLDATVKSLFAGKYENIIFNELRGNPSDYNLYFVGYRFNLID